MLCFKFWKELIEDIKEEYLDTIEYAWDMLVMILFTPILLAVDIIIIPYSLCYLIVKLIQNKADKED